MSQYVQKNGFFCKGRIPFLGFISEVFIYFQWQKKDNRISKVNSKNIIVVLDCPRRSMVSVRMRQIHNFTKITKCAKKIRNHINMMVTFTEAIMARYQTYNDNIFLFRLLKDIQNLDKPCFIIVGFC